MADLNEAITDVKTSEAEQNPVIEQTGERKSAILSLVKGNYSKKIEKNQKQIEKLKEQILVLTTDRSYLENKISDLENKANLENTAIIALCNSNNFLESVKGQSFRIDSILIFLSFHNNRKKIKKERKIHELKAEIAGIKTRITLINKNTETITSKIESCEVNIKRYDTKNQNIAAIEKMNIANPAISFFLAKNSEEAAADIGKYCYKEVSEEELPRLEGFEYSRRNSKINEKRVIIRFEKIYKEQFEKALA